MSSPSEIPFTVGVPVEEQEECWAHAVYATPLPVSCQYFPMVGEFVDDDLAVFLALMESDSEDGAGVSTEVVAFPVASTQQRLTSAAVTVEDVSSLEKDSPVTLLPDECVCAVSVKLDSEFDTKRDDFIERDCESLFSVESVGKSLDHCSGPAEDSDSSRSRYRKNGVLRWRSQSTSAVDFSGAEGQSSIKPLASSKSKSTNNANRSALSARQQATARRTRENGKFQRSKVKWLSAASFFS